MGGKLVYNLKILKVGKMQESGLQWMMNKLRWLNISNYLGSLKSADENYNNDIKSRT